MAVVAKPGTFHRSRFSASLPTRCAYRKKRKKVSRKKKKVRRQKALPNCHTERMGTVRDHLRTDRKRERERDGEMEIKRETEEQKNLRGRRRSSIVTIMIYP